ncbi:MAG: hypothetical protein K2I96_16715 [Lachnospiraceae bacterium]|nr:hypothetical protein [Lachnospiraceae bacterium]
MHQAGVWCIFVVQRHPEEICQYKRTGDRRASREEGHFLLEYVPQSDEK